MISRPARRLMAWLIAVAAAPLAPGARAATLPDWAQEIANREPPLEEAPARTPSRVLLRETRVVVRPDGSQRMRYRLALQALVTKPEGIRYGMLGYGGTQKVESSRAWHLRPGKEVEKSRRLSAFDVTLDDAFLTDAKTRVVAMEGVRRGSLVFFEFELSDQPYTLAFIERFLEEGPIRLARFELETPPGWTVRAAWLRLKGPVPVVAGNIRRWELENLPEPVDEPLGEPAAHRAPLLVVNLVPPPGAAVRPAVIPDWASLSAWYAGLLEGRDAVTPEISAAAKQASSSAGADPVDRLRAEAVFVRDSVRYIAKELGIGGYRPHAAAQTLRDRYGDCKDKGTLFQSLLAAEGVSAYPLLISLGEPESVAEEVADAGSFDHLIVAVPLPAEIPVPEALAPAILDAGDLGRLLFVDTTDEYASFGSLSAGLAGRRGLLVAGPRGRLVKLPETMPDAHRMLRRLQAELLPDRSLSVVLATEFLGQPAAGERHDYRRSSEEHHKDVERWVQEAWPGSTLGDDTVQYETAEGKFIETLKLTAASLPRSGPGAWLSLFPGARDELPRVSLVKRQTPVVYDYPRLLRYEVEIRGVPEAARMPEARSLRSDGWSVSASASREGAVLRAVWELRLTRTRFAPDSFDELRRLWSAIDATARADVDASS